MLKKKKEITTCKTLPLQWELVGTVCGEEVGRFHIAHKRCLFIIILNCPKRKSKGSSVLLYSSLSCIVSKLACRVTRVILGAWYLEGCGSWEQIQGEGGESPEDQDALPLYSPWWLGIQKKQNGDLNQEIKSSSHFFCILPWNSSFANGASSLSLGVRRGNCGGTMLYLAY